MPEVTITPLTPMIRQRNAGTVRAARRTVSITPPPPRRSAIVRYAGSTSTLNGNCTSPLATAHGLRCG